MDLLHIADDPVPLSDITSLDGVLQKITPVLMVFDPIQSFLGEVDTHRASKIRPVLDALSSLAKKHGCCILLLRHLIKANSRRVIHRGLGGIDLSAAARSELLAGNRANDPKQYALVHIKTNLGPTGVSLGYAIRASGFSWTGESSLTAADLLASESHRQTGEAMIEAKEFLVAMLSQGPCLASQMIAELKEAGISTITWKRAKKALKIESTKIGQSGPFEWALPEGAQIPPTQES